eukprot:CAMPEP_0178458278 /NCGR_PEP_ID=MMETSP0689_2-20121128/47464_1 /TAXON_ID=160604 /ORGANISM="Amphidinium massartii, Strain CS-259" /LENGTH=325 /DNA_ID=CAMNT_0020084583 /DNA_START=15 /DNA_END=992 /DNA_ORIENTATION=-
MAATVTPASLQEWRRKPIPQWSTREVQAFLEVVLPGHSSPQLLSHWTGKVLASVTKEDLRKQVKDEESVNVIWAELRHLEGFLQERDAVAAEKPDAISIFIRSASDAALQLEVLPMDTVAEVKLQVARLGGPQVEQQRLVWNGVPMSDTRTLASYAVGHDAVILSVPRLGRGATGAFKVHAEATSKQPLQPPGRPESGIPKPRVPVLCADMARPFDIFLEFASIPEYQSFMLAVQRGGGGGGPSRPSSSPSPLLKERKDAEVFLEVLSADGMRAPVQTRILFDPQAELLRIDTLGDILMQRTRYRVLLHAQDEHKLAHLVTGSQM